MKTTIGGDRLGGGGKQEVSFRNYERSTHDLSYTWRSTMGAGTLVPFLNELALPGDSFEIDLNCQVLTLPTIGPLFGSYKVQLDVFEIPIRLYNASLHMNKVGIGMQMDKIYLPQMRLKWNNLAGKQYWDNEQVNASSLFKYLGISGLGNYVGSNNNCYRDFNAVSYLAYWEIYKQYYSNKQEGIGAYIHTNQVQMDENMTPKKALVWDKKDAYKGDAVYGSVIINDGNYMVIAYPSSATKPRAENIEVTIDTVTGELADVFSTFTWDQANCLLTCKDTVTGINGKAVVVVNTASPIADWNTKYFGIKTFPLTNIDDMRSSILQASQLNPFIIDGNADPEPYGCFADYAGTAGTSSMRYSITYSQEGLALKTYQSDLFNNWINTEWIDGAGGISELTAVDTTTGEFTIDALNIATKVYEMLNRIAISGGTYDNWLDAVYTHERTKGVDSPVYCGSLIKELSFEEVVSQAETADKPLGTLAGRGKLTGKHKGGKINIKTGEPSYILGICSITPRVEYSQGNTWHTNLKTFDDFHKPALDAIGFQDLISDQLLWTDTTVGDSGAVTFKSLGKQPAWINYMTNVNKCYGGFAEPFNSMWMVLNRRYEKDIDGSIKDATTYIDPSKYNHIFADTSLDSQNFWMQIAVGLTARRKMSAKVIPNL